MNRIAVILRGHLRTWNYIKPAVFDFWEGIATEVDYYFVTWRTPGLKVEEIKNDFKGKNLVKLLTVEIPSNDPEGLIYSSWGGPSWLSYNIAPYKKEREKTVKYDAVIDTRPDILYNLVDNKSIITPEPMTLYTSNITGDTKVNKYYIGLADILFIMPSNVYDILSTRYINKSSILGSHYDLIKICDKEKINACKVDWVHAVITRPNSIDSIPDSKDYFNLHKKNSNVKDPYAIEEEWANISSDEKIVYLNKHNIALDDYKSSNSPRAKL